MTNHYKRVEAFLNRNYGHGSGG